MVWKFLDLSSSPLSLLSNNNRGCIYWRSARNIWKGFLIDPNDVFIDGNRSICLNIIYIAFYHHPNKPSNLFLAFLNFPEVYHRSSPGGHRKFNYSNKISIKSQRAQRHWRKSTPREQSATLILIIKTTSSFRWPTPPAWCPCELCNSHLQYTARNDDDARTEVGSDNCQLRTQSLCCQALDFIHIRHGILTKIRGRLRVRKSDSS